VSNDPFLTDRMAALRRCSSAGEALQQVWLFLIVLSIAGAVAGWLFRNRVLAP
jgi:hypothetical protein